MPTPPHSLVTRSTAPSSQAVEFSPLADIVHEPIAYGATWLVAGEPGTGKTTLAFQFAIQGLRRGEAAIFVACDEPPARIERNLRAFGFGTSSYERERRFVLVDAFSRDSDLPFHVSDRTDVAEFIYVVTEAVHWTGKPCRVITDSLTSIEINLPPRDFLAFVYEKNRALRDDELALLDLFLTHRVDSPSLYPITNAYDVLIELYVSEEKVGVPKRHLRVRKLRGGPYDPRPFPFTIRPQQGVVVNTNYYSE